METDGLIRALSADTGPREAGDGPGAAAAAGPGHCRGGDRLCRRHRPAPGYRGSSREPSLPVQVRGDGAACRDRRLRPCRPCRGRKRASRRKLIWLAAAPVLLLAAIAARAGSRAFRPNGARGLSAPTASPALTLIPLMGIGPLALFIAALRHGAPSRPALAGAVAGLAAGGIAATLYAAHCTDDLPLFVATWYTLAIAILTGLGALAGRASRVGKPRRSTLCRIGHKQTISGISGLPPCAHAPRAGKIRPLGIWADRVAYEAAGTRDGGSRAGADASLSSGGRQASSHCSRLCCGITPRPSSPTPLPRTARRPSY